MHLPPHPAQAVDMWAVGCIVAEMFVGKPLLPGSSTMDQLAKVLEVPLYYYITIIFSFTILHYSVILLKYTTLLY